MAGDYKWVFKMTDKPNYDLTKYLDSNMKYKEFCEAVSAIIFKHDPMQINFEFNTDEYDPEAETIVPRIETCSNETELSSVLHEEFSHWFGSEISGSPNDYHALAQEIWSLAIASRTCNS